MRVSLAIFGLVCVAFVPEAEAQQRARAWSQNTRQPMSLRGYRGLRASTDRRASTLASRLDPYRPDIYGRARLLGLRTRVDRIRDVIPYRRQGTRLVGQRTGPSNPVSILLNQRNHLSARSALGGESWGAIGRHYYAKDDQGRWSGEVAPDVEPAEAVRRLEAIENSTAPTYEDRLESRLSKKVDEYYRLGLFFFQQGQYVKAREYFELVAQQEPHKARAYVASVLVSYQRGDFSTATLNLVLALDEKRSKSLSDLWVDPLRFYPERRGFQTAFKQLSRATKSGASSAPAHLLFSYYAWLNGDINTAIGAAQMAEASLDAEISRKASDSGPIAPEDRATYAKRFRKMLIEARDKRVASEAAP